MYIPSDLTIPDISIEKMIASGAPILVCFSGGKDSIAMVLHLLESGVPRDQIHLHHHDVDGQGEKLYDWACTESYCKAFAKAFGLKLFFSYRKGGIVRNIYRNDEPLQDVYFQSEVDGAFHVAYSDTKSINTRMKFPAMSRDLNARGCSSAVKIDVLKTAISHNRAYDREIYILTGERREEGGARTGYEEVLLHAKNTKSRKAIQWRIVIDWTEQQVWDIMRRWQITPHPAYHLGWSRCSCQLCIFNDPNIWAMIHQVSPEKIDRVDEMEKDLGFTMYKGETIRQRVARGVVFGSVSEFWIEQATGTFTAPMFTENWTLPLGAFKKQSAGAI